MEQITSSTPGLYWLGTKDKSGGPVKMADSPLPFVRPIAFFFSPYGKEGPAWMPTTDIVSTYGDKVIDFDSEYATHGMTYLSRVIKAKTYGIAWRLRPKDAKPPSKIGIDLEYIKDNIPLYERDKVTQMYILDDQGRLKPTGEKTVGYRFEFHIVPIVEAEDGSGTNFGRRGPTVGTLTSEIPDETAKRVPLCDWDATDFGSEGNNLGFRLWAPTISSATAADPDLEEEVDAFLYRMQIVRRPSMYEAAKVIPDKYDATSTLFSFDTNVVSSENGGVIYDLDARVPGNWEDDSADFYQRSQIRAVHLYRENLEPFLQAVQAVEKAYGTVPDTKTGYRHVNFLGARTVENVPYYTLQPESIKSGSISFTENTTVFLEGGSDGTMSNAVYNAMVKEIFDDLSAPGVRLDNNARYPFNFFVDSGFDLKTKFSLMNLLRNRQDSFLVLSTQDISRAPNDNETEESIASSILTRLQMFPDSIEFSTPPFRGGLFGHCGYLADSKRPVRATLSIDIGYKLMRYGSQSSGILNPDLAPDTSENGNYIVTEVKTLNVIDKSWREKRRLWQSSVNYVEDFDHNKRLFYPGIQSFYPDKTSVLNSAIVGLCVAQLARYAWETWRDLTGNQKLKEVQLIERSNKSIENRVAGTMDDRMDVIPHSQITRADKDRGYSWSMPIDVGANGMKTVLSAHTIAYRREDLNG